MLMSMKRKKKTVETEDRRGDGINAKLQRCMDELIAMLAAQHVPKDVAERAAAAALSITPDHDQRISSPFRYLASMNGAVAQVLEDAGL